MGSICWRKISCLNFNALLRFLPLKGLRCLQEIPIRSGKRKRGFYYLLLLWWEEGWKALTGQSGLLLLGESAHWAVVWKILRIYAVWMNPQRYSVKFLDFMYCFQALHDSVRRWGYYSVWCHSVLVYSQSHVVRQIIQRHHKFKSTFFC